MEYRKWYREISTLGNTPSDCEQQQMDQNQLPPEQYISSQLKNKNRTKQKKTVVKEKQGKDH